MLYNNICLPLACVNINYVHDNPGHLTCDCVLSDDECFEDGRCVREDRCQESDSQPTGNNVNELRISKLIIPLVHLVLYHNIDLFVRLCLCQSHR